MFKLTLFEAMYYYKLKRFDGEDVIQLCNRDGGYEAGYAAYICDHTTEDDLFETVIFKTKRYLQTPHISNAVYDLAAYLNQVGEADHDEIAGIARHHGVTALFGCLTPPQNC